MSPDPNARPAPSPKNFDPYTHEMARRRRAYYASQAREAPDVGEGWARPGWGEGFGAPKSERSEWNGEGWRERVVLALGVVVRWGPFFVGVLLTGVLARRSWRGCFRLCRRHWRMRFSRLTRHRLLRMNLLHLTLRARILPTPLLFLATTLRHDHHHHHQEDSSSHLQWTSTNDTGRQ